MAFNQATAQPSAAPEAAPVAKGGGWGEPKVAAFKAHLIRYGAPPDVAERTARDPDTQARQDALAQPGGVRKQFLGSLTGSMLPEGFTTTVSPFVQRMMLASQLDPESGRVPDASLRELITPNPNSTSAGVAQAGTEFVRQNVNPLNAMLLGGGTALGALAKGTGPVANAARLALRAMGVGFGAQQAQTAGEQAGAASVPQPGQTPAQRAAAWTAPALSAAASLASTASAFAPGRPGGAAPVTDAELRGARNVSPVPEQQRLAGNQPLALPAPKAEAPAPAPQAAPTTIPGKLSAEETVPVEPTVFREGQEVSYSLPDGQEARGIVAASTANGRVKITTQTGETLRVPIARVSNVAPAATKAPEGFDAASAEPDIEVQLSEPETPAGRPVEPRDKQAAAAEVNKVIVDQANQLADIHGSDKFPRAKLDEQGNIDLTGRARPTPEQSPAPATFPIYPELPDRARPGSDIFKTFGDATDKWKSRVGVWLKDRPFNKPIIWQEPTSKYGPGTVRALSRNAGDSDNPWRVTSFWPKEDGTLMSSGHQVYKTREAAMTEEGRHVGELFDHLPGRVLTEQEIYGYTHMNEVADPTKLSWYKVEDPAPETMVDLLRQQHQARNLVIDSFRDGKIAFVGPVDPKVAKAFGLVPELGGPETLTPKAKSSVITDFKPVVAEAPGGKTVPVESHSQLAGGFSGELHHPDSTEGILSVAEDDRSHGDESLAAAASEIRAKLKGTGIDFEHPLAPQAKTNLLDELRSRAAEIAAKSEAIDIAGETKRDPSGTTRPTDAAPLSLESLTIEQQAAEAAAKKAQLEAKARQDKIEKLSEKPLTGDSSNVAQGQIFSGDEDLFSGPSLESEASPEPAGPRTAMSAADRARMRAEEMPELQAQMGIGGYTLRDLFVGKRAALSNAGLSAPLRLQSPSAAAAKGGWSGELKSMRESAPFSWFHNKGVNVEDGLMETLNELGFDAKSPEEALDMVRRAAAGEDVHPTGSSAQFRSERGGVDARVLRTLAVTGAAGGGAAYGYSQGTSDEDKIRKAIGYGAAAAVAAYIASKIPEAFADNAAGGMAVALRAARNSIENAVIGGKDLPNMRAASEPATNAAFRLANARIYGVQQGLNLAAQVLGDHWNDPVFAEKLGSVLVQEMQEAKIIQLHDALLAAKTPGEKAKIQGQIDKVKPVWDMPATQINSPQEFRDALADPEIQSAIERHKKLVQATAEQIHVELGGKLAAVGPNTGAFINTEAILAGNDLPGAANKGDLQNVLKRKTAFGKGRTGTADQYEIDYNRQVARMAAGNAERIAKKDYYDTLEQERLAEVTQPGERPADAEKFRRERTQELSVTGRLEDTWIRRDIFGEHRQLMNTDSPLDNHMVMVAARIANLVQLKSITDPTFHVANIVSSIAGAQGGGSRLADIGRQMPGVNVADALVRVGNRLGDVSKMDPQTRADLAEIARVGGLREGHPGLVNSVDRAGRLVMNDLFQSLVDEGLAKDSEGNRRDFVNQIGQYNARLMGKIKAFFKEVGIAPFIVAGQNFNRLGVRRLLQQPGVTATGAGAAAKMVGTAVAGTLASLVVAPAIFNYLANRNDDRVKNKLLGPSGTPVGAIGWQDPDANGKPGTLHYVDPLKWTNLRRGARITGLNAVASGIVQGRDLNHTVGQAWEDIRNGAVQPWAGPAINAFSILATGKNAAGFQEAEVANPLDRTQSPTASQAGRNATAAASHLQPQVAAFLQGGRDKNPAKFDAGAGAKGVVKSLARAGGYFERNPVDAEHGAAESALYSEELGREQRREQIQKLASGWPTMTQAEKTKATDGMSELDGKDLVEALHQNSLGFTSADRMIHSMGVEDGARAKYLADQVMKLSPAEQLKYLDDKDRKGLITDNVSEQLVEELKARGFRPAKAK